MPTLKHIAVFYIAIFLPLLAIILMAKTGLINGMPFVILLFLYAFIYRPLMCGMRLISLGLIKKSDLFRNFIPFWTNKYYNLLFFNRA